MTPGKCQGQQDEFIKSLLELEGADNSARKLVAVWLDRTRGILLKPCSSEEANHCFSSLLEWVQTLESVPDTHSWRLSEVSRNGRGSCLGLVNATVVVGRSLGLDATVVATRDHVLLGITLGDSLRYYDVAEQGVERSLDELLAAHGLRHKAQTPAYFRPLTGKEVLAVIRIERGAEELESGLLGKSAKDLKWATRNFPDHPAAYLDLGLLKFRMKHHRSAEQLFSRAILLDHRDSRPWYYRAVTRFQLGEIESALQDVNEALRINPKNWGALDLRNKLNRQLERPNPADF